ncbi:peptidoglycan editing factor PgeF [Oscillospiraceae bacterium OttesenSCG-928-F05]|nr:peptidoglycan editing factor PgeF [Oscillospiraceae bacterium OttesenSCG-928-F05]
MTGFYFEERAGVTLCLSALLETSEGVSHGFTTKLGGVSTGDLASLNIAYSRDTVPGAVAENYRRLGAAVGFDPEKTVFSRQVHGNDVRVVTAPPAERSPEETLPPYDALVTDIPGIPLVVFSADCVPILLWDPVHRAIGAVHAGWRGTANGALREALRTMTGRYRTDPAHVVAAIGPAIGPCCFACDEDVFAPMTRAHGNLDGYAEKCGTKWHIDLKKLNARWLESLGVPGAHIAVSPQCTACDRHHFWSHRRDGERRGSQGAVIVINA